MATKATKKFAAYIAVVFFICTLVTLTFLVLDDLTPAERQLVIHNQYNLFQVTLPDGHTVNCVQFGGLSCDWTHIQ